MDTDIVVVVVVVVVVVCCCGCCCGCYLLIISVSQSKSVIFWPSDVLNVLARQICQRCVLIEMYDVWCHAIDL